MENEIKKRFDQASKDYVTDKYVWRHESAQLVSKLVNPNAKDIILDLGCGTGKQIIELSAYIKLGIGIDISDGMIEQATKYAQYENVENVEFYTGSFDNPQEKINLRVKQITKIISNYALHHLHAEGKKKAIDKMVEIGGQSLQSIVIGDLMFFENPDNFRDEFNIIGYGPGNDKPSTVEELQECFSNLPFHVEVHKLHPLVGVLVASKKE